MADGWKAVFDEGLDVLANDADKIYICSADPNTFADISTYGLGVQGF
jgi:hypothetical protein